MTAHPTCPNEREQQLKRYLIALTAFVLVIGMGTGTALAGGSSDASGDGFHCYLFFSLPDGRFAQAMINDSIPEEVLMKAEECLAKYEDDEGGLLELAIGNIEDTLCASLGYEENFGGCSSHSDCQLGDQCCPNGQCIDGRGYCEEDNTPR